MDVKISVKLACKWIFTSIFTSNGYPMLLSAAAPHEEDAPGSMVTFCKKGFCKKSWKLLAICRFVFYNGFAQKIKKEIVLNSCNLFQFIKK